MRKPLFWVALALLASAFSIELGSQFALVGLPADAKFDAEPPGIGIPYLALLDGLLLWVVLLTGLGMVLEKSMQARAQGIVTLIMSIIVIGGGIVMILYALALLILMVSLLLAAPFGTLTYLGMYGVFPGGSAAALSAIMLLKVGFAVCLVLSQQRFLQIKSLVLLILCSLLANVIVSFLQGFPPSILVSITDTIAALVVAILGVIWAVFFLLFSIPAVFKAIG